MNNFEKNRQFQLMLEPARERLKKIQLKSYVKKEILNFVKKKASEDRYS